MKKLLFTTILATVLVGCSGGRNSTGYSIINDMVQPVGYEAYSENPIYKDGKSNQLAQKGTIARGFLPDKLDENGKVAVIANPHPMTDYAWERGEMLYKATCTACHGEAGKGDGLVVSEGGFPKPPSFKARKWKKKSKYPAGYVYKVITEGFGNMPAHAQQLYKEDRWYVSEYVRQKLMKRK